MTVGFEHLSAPFEIRGRSGNAPKTSGGFAPIAVVDIELDSCTGRRTNLPCYKRALLLVRKGGVPLGYVFDDGASEMQRMQKIKLLEDKFARRCLGQVSQAGFEADCGPLGVARVRRQPLVTVAVCTRNRHADLDRCLQAVSALNYPRVELLVVDNAPDDDKTRQLIDARYPNARYVLEPLRGLSHARNRAIREMQGDILAFTDDDVVVDKNWLDHIVRGFADDPDVMAVTGLIVPYELERASQLLFELYGGFGKGFTPGTYRADGSIAHLSAGRYGAGANMAFRCDVFNRIGAFNTNLGVGKVGAGGEDIEMFFRTLDSGYAIRYEPSAIVRHRHRLDETALRQQIANNGVGCAAYILESARRDPWRKRIRWVAFVLQWIFAWQTPRLLRTALRREMTLLDLCARELLGSVQGLARGRM